MASHLGDEDLYTLTYVSHRIASIVFPIYFARKELLLSSHTNSLSLCGEGFKALDVWRRSPTFLPLRRLACSFSFDTKLACTQIQYLKRCFDSLPPDSRTFVRSVCLTHIMANSLDEVLALLQGTVLLTSCLHVTLSDVTFAETPRPASVSHASRRPRIRVNGRKRTVVTTYLDSLELLRLTGFDLSSSQWHELLSSLSIPKLDSLEIWGSSSMIAIFHFLLQHSHVGELRFICCSWNDASSSPYWLKLPFLRTLQGYPYQIRSILRSLRSTPVLRDLVIASDSTAVSQNDHFIDEVAACLALCGGSVSLEVEVPNDQSMAGLTIADARALAARKLDSLKLDSDRLPFIEILRIKFPAEMLDAIFLVRSLFVNNSVLNFNIPFFRFVVNFGWRYFLT